MTATNIRRCAVPSYALFTTDWPTDVPLDELVACETLTRIISDTAAHLTRLRTVRLTVQRVTVFVIESFHTATFALFAPTIGAFSFADHLPEPCRSFLGSFLLHTGAAALSQRNVPGATCALVRSDTICIDTFRRTDRFAGMVVLSRLSVTVPAMAPIVSGARSIDTRSLTNRLTVIRIEIGRRIAQHTEALVTVTNAISTAPRTPLVRFPRQVFLRSTVA